MMRLNQKLFSTIGLSTLITLLMSSGVVQATPPCYMVNQAGQTVDLSYMCNQNTARTQPQETEPEGRTFSRRVPVNNSTSQNNQTPQTPETPIRSYSDIQNYVRQQREAGNVDNVWEDINYYNGFLEFPSTMSRRTAVRQEISPRIVRYSREVWVNPDGSEIVLSNGNSSRVSRHRVIGSNGLPEYIFVDYTQSPSVSFSPSYTPVPRNQVRSSIPSSSTGQSSNVVTNFVR